jgi:hypothetical protein
MLHLCATLPLQALTIPYESVVLIMSSSMVRAAGRVDGVSDKARCNR